MERIVRLGQTKIIFLLSAAALALAGCGGNDAAPAATAVPAGQPESAAAPTASPTPTTAPPTAAPPTTAPPTVAPTATPRPTATAVPEPTPTPEPTKTPVPLTSYDEFGFVLKLDRGAGVQSAGWTEAEPSDEQGLINFEFGGVTAILTWNPVGSSTTLSSVNNVYEILQEQRQDLTFNTLSEGDVTVSGQLGFFAGYRTVDPEGEVGGGLIGAWICPVADTVYTLVVRGPDATLVQLRFDRLLNNFACQ